MFDGIEKIIYINLDKRTDRKREIEKTLCDIPKEKLIRFQQLKINMEELVVLKVILKF